jgi:hypothetical protein
MHLRQVNFSLPAEEVAQLGKAVVDPTTAATDQITATHPTAAMAPVMEAIVVPARATAALVQAMVGPVRVTAAPVRVMEALVRAMEVMAAPVQAMVGLVLAMAALARATAGRVAALPAAVGNNRPIRGALGLNNRGRSSLFHFLSDQKIVITVARSPQ